MLGVPEVESPTLPRRPRFDADSQGDDAGDVVVVPIVSPVKETVQAPGLLLPRRVNRRPPTHPSQPRITKVSS